MKGATGTNVRNLAGAIIVALAGSFVSAAAVELHTELCLNGCPAGFAETNDVVVRPIYVLSSNDSTKFADWVAYRVTESSIGQTRRRNWKADPVLAEVETLEPSDYAGANSALGTERGHQVPLASFTGTPHWKTTNLLSNITPQMSALNQGPWKKLEKAVRDLARRRGEDGVFVMTGPLYEGKMPSLPGADEEHQIPSGYWKVVAVDDGEVTKVAGFVFDQKTERDASHCKSEHVATVREIEDKTGLDFFHALTQDEQDAIEMGVSALLSELGCES